MAGAGRLGADSAAFADRPTPDGTPPEVPTHTLLHLSDTHLTSRGVAYNGVLDSDAALARVVSALQWARAGGRRWDAVIVSGDLTDTGDPDAYRRLAAALAPLAEPAASDPPVPILYATGNHDVRTVFHAELLDRPDETGPVLQVRMLGGLRVIVADSTVPGAGYGRLTDDHLAELRDALARRAPAGTILVLHHAPLPPPSVLLSYYALEAASRAALAETLRGSDVRLVLAGHHHLARFGTLAGIPVAVAGSTTIRSDPLAPPGTERTTGSSAYNLVELYPDGAVVSVIPVDDAREVFALDEAACRAVIDRH